MPSDPPKPPSEAELQAEYEAKLAEVRRASRERAQAQGHKRKSPPAPLHPTPQPPPLEMGLEASEVPRPPVPDHEEMANVAKGVASALHILFQRYAYEAREAHISEGADAREAEKDEIEAEKDKRLPPSPERDGRAAARDERARRRDERANARARASAARWRLIRVGHDLSEGFDAKDANTRRAFRAVELLDKAKASIGVAPNDAEVSERRFKAAIAQLITILHSEDPYGLGTVRASAWLGALLQWRVERQQDGSHTGLWSTGKGNRAPERRYSGNAILHALLRSAGLTEAEDVQSLIKSMTEARKRWSAVTGQPEKAPGSKK